MKALSLIGQSQYKLLTKKAFIGTLLGRATSLMTKGIGNTFNAVKKITPSYDFNTYKQMVQPGFNMSKVMGGMTLVDGISQIRKAAPEADNTTRSIINGQQGLFNGSNQF